MIEAIGLSPLAWGVLFVVVRTAWGLSLTLATARAGTHRIWAGSAIVADIFASLLMLAWWHVPVRQSVGTLVLPMFAYLLCFELFAAVYRVYTMSEPATADGMTGRLLGALVETPAIIAWELICVAPPLVAGAALSFMA